MKYLTPTTQWHLDMLQEGNIYPGHPLDNASLDLGKHSLMTAPKGVLLFNALKPIFQSC